MIIYDWWFICIFYTVLFRTMDEQKERITKIQHCICDNCFLSSATTHILNVVHKLKSSLELIKKILIGILLIGIISIIGFFVFMANFEIFDGPTETELKVECDYEGLRKVKMTEMTGNVTLNRSIHIYATDSNYDENIKAEPIFIASAGFIKSKDVNFEWKSFDTLTIKYNKKLEIFKQKTESESINPKIVIEYITD